VNYRIQPKAIPLKEKKIASSDISGWEGDAAG
jgi:hypothetical protein